MFNWMRGMFCSHLDSKVIYKYDWIPTFHTTNGLDDEDERVLVFECNDCDCRFKRKQFKRGFMGELVNYKDIK